MTKNQERPGISDFSDSPHNGCHDTYGPLLSALFEVPPGGASAFVTSTPKQARIALDKSGPTRTAGDLEIKNSPCAKEKRRYGKEWSPSESRNRRNTSLGGGVRLKALPSPSSSTHSLYIDTGLGQWFSKDPPSQSSSLDSLASYYSTTPEKRCIIKNSKPQKPIICGAQFTGSGLLKHIPNDFSLVGSISNTTSNPDLRAYNDHSASTHLKSALVWDKIAERQGSPSHGGHNRSHSLASPPSGALRRRQTSRRHAIYGGTGLPGIPVPYDDPEETRVNPSRATIASFDSNKAVCAISEDSFSDSPKKDYVTGLASVSPVKPLSTTPERVRRFFDTSADDSGTHYYDMSITAVSSGSSDENLDLLGYAKANTPVVLPLNIRSASKCPDTSADWTMSRTRTFRDPSDSDELGHLPLMHELLDLVEEATESWRLL